MKKEKVACRDKKYRCRALKSLTGAILCSCEVALRGTVKEGLKEGPSVSAAKCKGISSY